MVNKMGPDIEKESKLPYVRPSLRAIELITEEVLADNCKVEGLIACDDVGGQTFNFGS